jgi:hypothetical protein
MTPDFSNKRPAYYIIAIVLLLLLGASAAYSWHERHALPPGSTPAPTGTSSSGILPDIPAPAGWNTERIDSSRIVFSHPDADTPFHAGATIDAEAFKTKASIGDQIKSLGEDHAFDSSKTWNSVNGRLILTSPSQEGSHTSVLTYTVWSQSQIYVFTFSPYLNYDSAKQAWVTSDAADLPVMK